MTQQNELQFIRKTPLVLTGIVLEILKNWFKTNSEQFKYDENKLETRIVIESSYKFDPADCQNRPGIYVKLGAIQPKGRGRAGFDDVNSVYPDSVSYTAISNGTLTVFCVSKLPGEVSQLAAEVEDVLLCFSPLIRDDFKFDIFDLASINEIGKIEESIEFWTIPIQMVFGFNETWVIKELGLKIKKILITVFATICGTKEI